MWIVSCPVKTIEGKKRLSKLVSSCLSWYSEQITNFLLQQMSFPPDEREHLKLRWNSKCFLTRLHTFSYFVFRICGTTNFSDNFVLFASFLQTVKSLDTGDIRIHFFWTCSRICWGIKRWQKGWTHLKVKYCFIWLPALT